MHLHDYLPTRPIATYVKVVQRESERGPFGTIRGWEREHERGYPPLSYKEVGSGDRHREIFLCMLASMCVFNAFWVRFGPEFQQSWADLEQVVLAYP